MSKLRTSAAKYEILAREEEIERLSDIPVAQTGSSNGTHGTRPNVGGIVLPSNTAMQTTRPHVGKQHMWTNVRGTAHQGVASDPAKTMQLTRERHSAPRRTPGKRVKSAASTNQEAQSNVPWRGAIPGDAIEPRAPGNPDAWCEDDLSHNRSTVPWQGATLGDAVEPRAPGNLTARCEDDLGRRVSRPSSPQLTHPGEYEVPCSQLTAPPRTGHTRGGTWL